MDFPTQALLTWFSNHQRTLPWRNTYEPYQVWVSEVMLQQTRVDQMLPYFERFLRQFPTIQSLASATEEDVLKAWEGLGYYSRARHLRQSAQQIVTQKKGQIPQTIEELKQLPGFGDYIAAAVSSIAFNQPHAVMDGNVLRVFARFFGLHSDITDASTKTQFRKIAQQIVPTQNARFFNQALMELGALVCLPQNPLCGQCPLNEKCFARIKNQQHELPMRAKKNKRPTRTFAALLVKKQDALWLVQRKQKLLQGLWEFPLVEFQPLKDSLPELEKKIAERFGVSAKISSEIGKTTHDYTHFRQIVFLFEATLENKNVEFRSAQEIQQLPLSKVNHKLWKMAFPVRKA